MYIPKRPHLYVYVSPPLPLTIKRRQRDAFIMLLERVTGSGIEMRWKDAVEAVQRMPEYRTNLDIKVGALLLFLHFCVDTAPYQRSIHTAFAGSMYHPTPSPLHGSMYPSYAGHRYVREPGGL
jgi:hypothetical protein